MSKDLLQSKIIDKIMEFKPKEISEAHFLQHTFNLHTRVISGYRTKKDLILPGVMLDEDFRPHVKQNKRDARTVLRHTLLWVRHDALQPNRYELEYCNSNNKETLLFILTKEEWVKLKLLLKLAINNEDI